MKQGNTIRGNRGFSLIEAMIGFFVLSIGMLGIASLQAVSLQAGKASVYTSVAMMKADELFESMRSNPTALSTYQNPGVNNVCTGTTIVCAPGALAEDDVYWWEQNLKAGLPDAATSTVTVLQAPVPPSKLATVQIKINWQERSNTSTSGESKTYTAETNICTAIPC